MLAATAFCLLIFIASTASAPTHPINSSSIDGKASSTGNSLSTSPTVSPSSQTTVPVTIFTNPESTGDGSVQNGISPEMIRFQNESMLVGKLHVDISLSDTTDKESPPMLFARYIVLFLPALLHLSLAIWMWVSSVVRRSHASTSTQSTPHQETSEKGHLNTRRSLESDTQSLISARAESNYRPFGDQPAIEPGESV